MFEYRTCDKKVKHLNANKNGHKRPQNRARKSMAIDLNAVGLSDDIVSEY